MYKESYGLYPVSLDVISWLGVYFVKSEYYEQAIHYFERASQIQPGEVKWRLMVTSCYRRMGHYQQALELYEKIHADHPENLECEWIKTGSHVCVCGLMCVWMHLVRSPLPGCDLQRPGTSIRHISTEARSIGPIGGPADEGRRWGTHSSEQWRGC